MRAWLALLLIAVFFPLLPFASTHAEECVQNVISCEDACCEGAGGQGYGGGCLTEAGEQASQFFACDEACGSAGIDCISPDPACGEQFRACAQACTGSPSSRQACIESCSLAGLECAETASENDSGSSGCCGSTALILLGGFAGLFIAARA